MRQNWEVSYSWSAVKFAFKLIHTMCNDSIIICETSIETLLLQPCNLTETLWYLPTHFHVYLLSYQLVIYTLWKGMSGFTSAVNCPFYKKKKKSSKTTEKCTGITGQHFHLLRSTKLGDLVNYWKKETDAERQQTACEPDMQGLLQQTWWCKHAVMI